MFLPVSKRLSLDDYYLQMLDLVAERSTCVRRQVGAIITTFKGRVLSTGYNGVPSGHKHCIETPCDGATDPKGDTSRCNAIHAEQNALLQCSQLELAEVLYVSVTPCFTCAKLICNTNIKLVYARQQYVDVLGQEILRNSGITVIIKPGDGTSAIFHGERLG